MKKSVAANSILLIIVATLAAGAWYVLRPPAARIGTAEFLPVGTRMVVEWRNLETSWQRAKSGIMARRFRKADITGAMVALGTPAETVQQYEEIGKAMVTMFDSRWFKELFGKEMLLALLPLECDEARPESLDSLQAKLVLISRPQRRAEVVEMLNQMFNNDIPIKTEQYGPYKINSFPLEYGFTVYYVLTDGVLMATVNEQTMHYCLGLRNTEGPNLSEHEHYQRLRTRLCSPHCVMSVYASTGILSELLTEAVHRNIVNGKEREQAQQSLAGLQGLAAVGVALYDDHTDVMQARGIAFLDKDQTDPRYARAYSFQPGENETLALAPAEVLLYCWMNILDLKTCWELAGTTSALDETARESMGVRVKKELGITIDELYETFGHQAALVLTDINTDGFIPIPNLAILVEVRKQDAAKKIMASALKQTGLQVERTTFNATEIVSVMLPFGNTFRPAYALFDGFCIIAVNPPLIRNFISSSGGTKKNITESPKFIAVDRGLTDKNNVMSFADVSVLMEKAEEVLDWRRKMLMFRQPDEAAREAIMLEKVVSPTLEAAKMIQSIGTRVFMGEEEVAGELFLKLEPGGD